MENVTLQVKGMSCGHCVSAVEGSVGKLNGVKAVKVDLGAGTVQVEFDPDAVTVDTIKETIDEQGYDVA
ncbi:copper chaperone CopZ [Ectobacillus ponti]|uniref:Copper chaperone CopZ n=1 Tax=Ectobacillus ponti TaxID=2961894 RepID=A0AA41X954_9BACI|nr:copper chaperone CopZ [Ectobacillus ponti]MCP8969438.1 copper chaperone CopZ [Ectobacillus ponti]